MFSISWRSYYYLLSFQQLFQDLKTTAQINIYWKNRLTQYRSKPAHRKWNDIRDKKRVHLPWLLIHRNVHLQDENTKTRCQSLHNNKGTENLVAPLLPHQNHLFPNDLKQPRKKNQSLIKPRINLFKQKNLKPPWTTT